MDDMNLKNMCVYISTNEPTIIQTYVRLLLHSTNYVTYKLSLVQG